MVNVQAGRVCETGIVIGADPAPRLGLAGIVDLDALAISLQHVLAVMAICQSASSYFISRNPRKLDVPSIAVAGDGIPGRKQVAGVARARTNNGDCEAGELGSRRVFGWDPGLLQLGRQYI